MRIARPYALPSDAQIARHVHVEAYAAVVLGGSYEEAGDCGRHRVSAGEVLVHDAFSAHCDRVPRGTTQVLDLPLAGADGWPARGTIADPEALVRLARRDAREAGAALAEWIVPTPGGETDLADLLAADLREGIRIGAWADEHGRRRETLTRQFGQLYGVCPARYRSEARAREAWRLIVRTAEPLAAIAAASGHADQAHMTRAVRALTGRTPAAWRRASHPFKTD